MKIELEYHEIQKIRAALQHVFRQARNPSTHQPKPWTEPECAEAERICDYMFQKMEGNRKYEKNKKYQKTSHGVPKTLIAKLERCLTATGESQNE